MHSYPGDITPVVVAVAGALVLMVVLSRLFSWYRLRALRLCLLTGTRPQRAALWVVLAPVILQALEFRSNNAAHQPLIQALELIQRHAGSTQRLYPATEDVPLEEARIC